MDARTRAELDAAGLDDESLLKTLPVDLRRWVAEKAKERGLTEVEVVRRIVARSIAAMLHRTH
jgi:hypothetical protein